MQEKESNGKVNIGLRVVASAEVERPADPPPLGDTFVERNENPPEQSLIDRDQIPVLEIVGQAPGKPVQLVMPNGSSITASIPHGFLHSTKYPTHQHWTIYCDWRKSKCPPINSRPPIVDLNQATLEFIGELGELACLVGEHGAAVVMYPELTAEVVDEAGDCFFCGAWALDAWGINFLRQMGGDQPGVAILGSDDLEIERTLYSEYKDILVPHEEPDWEPTPTFIQMVKVFEHYSGVANLGACAHGNLTANALKKMLFQRRQQDPRVQCERIMMALTSVERCLVLCGKTVEDALLANITKLDARFPDGFQGDGGIRTGKGR